MRGNEIVCFEVGVQGVRRTSEEHRACLEAQLDAELAEIRELCLRAGRHQSIQIEVRIRG